MKCLLKNWFYRKPIKSAVRGEDKLVKIYQATQFKLDIRYCRVHYLREFLHKLKVIYAPGLFDNFTSIIFFQESHDFFIVRNH